MCTVFVLIHDALLSVWVALKRANGEEAVRLRDLVLLQTAGQPRDTLLVSFQCAVRLIPALLNRLILFFGFLA